MVVNLNCPVESIGRKMRALILLAGVMLFTISSSTYIDLDSTLQCHRRVYNHTVSKKDIFGKICWDTIPILTCWGRCDSHEISDWKFPYKRSHHPVCLHDVRERTKIILRNCEESVEPGTEVYEYLQALTCKCSVCKSSEASCEGLRYREYRFHDIVMN